jgi:hypothetical protein
LLNKRAAATPSPEVKENEAKKNRFGSIFLQDGTLAASPYQVNGPGRKS